MATSQQQLVCDSSTLANFKQWAQAISTFFSTATWTQSTDTGQVNWSTIGAVPGSGAYVYEIWQPNDGLTTFYVKIEYGNVSGSANCPGLRLSIGSGSNGSGTLAGLVMGPQPICGTSYTPPSTTLQYECDFSGAAGRIGVMMWRNSPTTPVQQFFAIERSVNSSGAYTSSYVTMWVAGNGGGLAPRFCTQASLVFGVGASPNSLNNSATTTNGGWLCRLQSPQTGTSGFNGSIPFDNCAPGIGYFDFPCTVCGAALGVDISEGVTFSVTLYGSTRTYLPSKIGPFSGVGPLGSGSGNVTAALCMRYD